MAGLTFIAFAATSGAFGADISKRGLTADSVLRGFSSRRQLKETPGVQKFKLFRFTPTATRSQDANSVQISEISFWYGGVKVSMKEAKATNPDGSNPDKEKADKAIDGKTNTKWLDFNKGALVITFPGAVAADQFTFTTANDFADRDPVSWTLEGTNCGGCPWMTLQKETNFDTPNARHMQTRWISFVNRALPTVDGFVKVLYEGEPSEDIAVNNCRTRAGQIALVIQKHISDEGWYYVEFASALENTFGVRHCWTAEWQVIPQVATMCQTGKRSKRTAEELAKFVGNAFDNIVHNYNRSFSPAVSALLSKDGLMKAIKSGKFNNFANGGQSDDMDKREVAAFLAHVYQETGQMRATIEDGCARVNKAKACFNYQTVWWCCGPGYKDKIKCDECADASNTTYYYGRGALQLSYPSNYANFLSFWSPTGGKYNAYTVNKTEAEKVGTESVYVWASALWFWTTPDYKKPSCSQVMQCDPDIDTSSPKGVKFGFGWTINLINGLLECNRTRKKAENRAKWFQSSQFSMGLVPLAADLTSCEHMEPY